jgi:hypothetical protein
MWLVTKVGFFSIVEKPIDIARGTLTVRARVLDDLEAFARMLPDKPLVGAADPRADYAFRITADKRDVQKVVAGLIDGIDYSNFKEEVSEVQGPERARVYSDVWEKLYALQEQP